MINQLKEYSHDDQLYYIGNFINHCKRICSKLEPDKAPISAESFLLNQLIKN